MDENTRKIIEHGKRIRICLKQSEFGTVSVSEQIMIFLALVSGSFDQVPIEKMPAAELAVKDAAKGLSKEIMKTLNSKNIFAAEERESIISVIRDALSTFITEIK